MPRAGAIEADVAILCAAQDERGRSLEIAPVDGRVRAAVWILERGKRLGALGEQLFDVHRSEVLRHGRMKRNRTKQKRDGGLHGGWAGIEMRFGSVMRGTGVARAQSSGQRRDVGR